VVIALLVVGAVMMCAFFACEWKIASLPILPCKLGHSMSQLPDLIADARKYICSAYQPYRSCWRKVFSSAPYTTVIYSTFPCSFSTSWDTRLSRLELLPSPIHCHNRSTVSYLDLSSRRQIGTRESSYLDLPSGPWESVSKSCGRRTPRLDKSSEY
jgi:hypothetical protein